VTARLDGDVRLAVRTLAQCFGMVAPHVVHDARSPLAYEVRAFGYSPAAPRAPMWCAAPHRRAWRSAQAASAAMEQTLHCGAP
jgi:hypothetical protein